jgi:uncharacterized membrane protein (GlpM family)
MSTLGRALSGLAGLIMIIAYVVVLLAIWPFVRRTESQLRQDSEDDN